MLIFFLSVPFNLNSSQIFSLVFGLLFFFNMLACPYFYHPRGAVQASIYSAGTVQGDAFP